MLSALGELEVCVAARKPAQSFDRATTGPTDADVLATASGEHPHDVCPAHRSYPVAMAPPMAAAMLERDAFTIDDLVAELRWPSPEPDVRWLETVGGVRSPIAFDGDSADLCAALEPDLVVLVADAGLGTINSVRLSAPPSRVGRWIVSIEPLRRVRRPHANRAWLSDRDVDVVTTGRRSVTGRACHKRGRHGRPDRLWHRCV